MNFLRTLAIALLLLIISNASPALAIPEPEPDFNLPGHNDFFSNDAEVHRLTAGPESEYAIRYFADWRSNDKMIPEGSKCDELLLSAQAEIGRVFTDDEILANIDSILEATGESLVPSAGKPWVSGIYHPKAPIRSGSKYVTIESLETGSPVWSWDTKTQVLVQNEIQSIEHLEDYGGYFIKVAHAPFNMVGRDYIFDLTAAHPGPKKVSKGSCFTGSMMVSTPSGPRRMEDIRAGDELISFNHVTGKFVANKVRNVMSYGPKPFSRLTDLGIDVTDQHPFFAAKNGQPADYCPIGQLSDSDSLFRQNGESIEAVPRGPYVPTGTAPVYDIEMIGEPRNFIVEGVLVHNKRMFVIM